MELRIGHLYAHYLNIYGDRGNILSLTNRCRWRGIETEVKTLGLNEDFADDYFDVFFIGGGQDKQQQVIAEDLQARKETIRQAVEKGAVILAVCGGYQLLGHYYRPEGAPDLPGISLIDAYTEAGKRRMIGNVVIKRNDGSTLVGFENHSGRTFLGKEVEALGSIVVGNGNNGEDGKEGCAQPVGKGKVFGTYLHGSLLPKNPRLADEIISFALSRRYGQVDLPALADGLEQKAHEYAVSLKA
ncbi:MAG: hypothetical protein K2W82_13840 [Candidatus Obscuribacterales bacterium]|nr:hypothetical protein [Candidatus Obscuribacterales bacterium]